MVDAQLLMDDVKFAKEMLNNAEENGGKLNPSDIVFGLRNILKMKYYPVAVKFFFDEDELEDFKTKENYKVALRPYTFCHYVAASRQRGDILLGTEDKLGCTNAKYVFGWKDMDDAEIKSHLKYARSWEQAEKFLKTKTRLPQGLLAFATAPLHLSPFEPDLTHGMCDPLQSYHLANDWCAAHDTHPFEMVMTMNSSVCHGCVNCHVTRKPNVTQMCSSSKTAGKTEQGEVNYI